MKCEDLLKLKELIENELAKEQTNEPKCIRWKPNKGETFWYVYEDGSILCREVNYSKAFSYLYNIGNCFKTKQEAEDYKENLLTKQALKDLALELDNGVEFDWNCKDIRKYCIYFSYDSNKLVYDWNWIQRAVSGVYCSNEKFYKIAIERIGEEKLIKLIKSGI